MSAFASFLSSAHAGLGAAWRGKLHLLVMALALVGMQNAALAADTVDGAGSLVQPLTFTDPTIRDANGNIILTNPSTISNGTNDPNNILLGAQPVDPMMRALDKGLTKALCSPEHQQAFAAGRNAITTYSMAQNQQLYKFQVSAAYAANCINRFADYVTTLSDAVDKVMVASKAALATNGGPESVAAAAASVIALEILDAVMKQIMQMITNQVCQVANEAVAALDSVVRNAICLPQIGGLNLDFNVNLDLGRTRCDGWSINPAGLAGQITEVPSNLNGSALTAPIVAGAPIKGIGRLSYSSTLPPAYRSDVAGSGDDKYFDYMEGTDIVDDRDTVAGMPDYTCASGSTGSMQDFMNALGKRESGGCASQYTCTTPSGSFRGKYQMGVQMLAQLKYVNCSNPQCKGDNWSTITWRGKNGVNSLEDYYGPIQETIMQDEIAEVLRQADSLGLDNYIGQTVCGVTVTKSGLAAAIHLLGAGGIRNSLQSGNCNAADGNGTTWMQYASMFGCFSF